MQTHLSSFPFDFSRLGNRIPALVYIELFGEGFVLKVRILVKILQKRKDICINILYDSKCRKVTKQTRQLTKSILYPDLMSSNSVTSTLDK